MADTFNNRGLQRVIKSTPFRRVIIRNAGELRERNQQLILRYLSCVKRRSREKTGHRIRYLGVEEGGSCASLVEVLCRQRIDIFIDLKLRGLVADVCYLKHHVGG